MTQQTIDFDRGEQLSLLRQVRIEKGITADGSGVSEAAQKSVLRAIDELAGYERGRVRECWASIDTIAGIAGIHRRQTIRAIEVLEARSLIICERRWNSAIPAVRNHYRVVWNELALLVGRQQSQPSRPEAETGPVTATNAMTAAAGTAGTEGPNPSLVDRDRMPIKQHRGEFQTPDHSAMVSDQSAMVTDHSAMVSNHSAMVAHNPPYPQERSATTRRASDPRGAAAEVLFFPDRSSSNETVLAEAFQSIGLVYWRPLVEQFTHLGVDHVLRAIATYRVNASRMRGPGALVSYLRFGAWPVDGIVDPDRAAAQSQREAQRRITQQRSNEATHLIRQYRSQRWSDEQIEHELARRGLEWP